MTKAIKLSPTETQILPVQVSVKAKESAVAENSAKEAPARAAIDLICVIDCSGSMQGEKIMLVQSTMRSLLQMLDTNDRLCIVRFESSAQRITPLLRV
jgi:Mg-chelatase subunit ChlD